MRILCISLVILLSLPVVAQDKPPRGPIPDFDSDLFASTATYRGANWRGKDSNDLQDNIRPGILNRDPNEDSNCNGISGWSPTKGMGHEDYFCGKSGAMGVVMFGDSAGAAFTIPKEWVEWASIDDVKNFLNPEWVKSQALREQTRQKRGETDLLPVVLHELDWPHKSWATGITPDIKGQSIYLKMRERNRCNHRDFQNLAVNGARSRHLSEQVHALARTPADRPILGFIAYIGNDICKDSLDKMTTPEEFRKNILAGLRDLDQKAPAGSKILLSGLADARVLFNTMHNRKHPWFGMTYAEFYDFLTFVDGNPCWTWLNRDSATRDKASARAEELSEVMKDIAKTEKFQNLELGYIPFLIKEVMDEWVKNGGDPADLIAAVDGFHPSLLAQRLIANKAWKILSAEYPSFIGQSNPHNDEIVELFGEQGGH